MVFVRSITLLKGNDLLLVERHHNFYVGGSCLYDWNCKCMKNLERLDKKEQVLHWERKTMHTIDVVVGKGTMVSCQPRFQTERCSECISQTKRQWTLLYPRWYKRTAPPFFVTCYGGGCAVLVFCQGKFEHNEEELSTRLVQP